jgi:uracil-DNA glycosylase family 4
MRWTDKQRAMLREIGIPAFWPLEAEPELSAPVPLAPPMANGDAPGVSPRLAAVAVAPADLAEPRSVNVPAPAPASARAAPSPAPASPLKPLSTLAALAEASLGARPAGIETMDWPALREAVAGCRACSLCSSRTQTVFGVGHPQADWLIVGEAPGEQEDKQGEPFVGRSGQLLDQMLLALGLSRSEGDAARQVYIANAIKCRPPANRNPQPQEMAQCEPFLMRQIALVQPKVILAMGRFAVQSILRSSEPIGKLRGRVHEVQGVPLIVTYHPAYLLRNPADKALAWSDLCLAREAMAAR